ncbi:uncharacterized protein LOC129614639 [Condylostylus longicornis]|uniref:uncharacterized protein LOC129614639 n=1 Tax=Condylostylus longicornis TaxID=2530218 RepID=UPI00244E4337|nr:uncharacterized protein LOC129614639 [Condylostylus longicornis]
MSEDNDIIDVIYDQITNDSGNNDSESDDVEFISEYFINHSENEYEEENIEYSDHNYASEENSITPVNFRSRSSITVTSQNSEIKKKFQVSKRFSSNSVNRKKPASLMKQNDTKISINCPICFNSTLKRQPTSTSCGHIFCYLCIRRCLLDRKFCPICKNQVDMINIDDDDDNDDYSY